MIIYYYDLDEVVAGDENCNMFVRKALPYLDDERKSKIAKIKPLKNKAMSAAAGLLIRKGFDDHLSKEGGHENAAISYEYTEHGKACIKGYPDFEFSLSHSGRYAVLAVSDSPVGIDVQEKKTAGDILKVSAHIMSEDELAALEKENDSAKKADFFFRIWSAKEAFVKMTGVGLSEKLGDFSCDFKQMKIIGNDGEIRGYIYEPASFDGYAFSVCSKKKGEQFLLTEVQI